MKDLNTYLAWISALLLDYKIKSSVLKKILELTQKCGFFHSPIRIFLFSLRKNPISYLKYVWAGKHSFTLGYSAVTQYSLF